MSKLSTSLDGKVALITGGGRGIGKAIALAFADHGANVIITARTDSQIEKASEEIRRSGQKCLAVKADISKKGEVTHLFEKSRKEFGRIDILVNNAGISKEQPFMDITLEDWDEALNINLMGVVHCTREVLPEMLERKQGKIINVASGAGQRGLQGNSAYSASKAAVIALSHSLAEEVGKSGINVNVICPGPIKTEMLAQSAVKDFILSNPDNLLMPDDVAGAALFLASDLSGGMNSQMLVIRTENRW